MKIIPCYHTPRCQCADELALAAEKMVSIAEHNENLTKAMQHMLGFLDVPKLPHFVQEAIAKAAKAA